MMRESVVNFRLLMCKKGQKSEINADILALLQDK